jgi:hypothetical protein
VESQEDIIVLADQVSRVTLASIAEPGLGFPTRIRAASGPFSVCVDASAQNYKTFREHLIRIHATLTGTARLEFWDEQHAISLTGNGRGVVDVVVELADSYAPWRSCLTIKLTLDQSNLPDIIRAVGRTFLSPK